MAEVVAVAGAAFAPVAAAVEAVPVGAAEAAPVVVAVDARAVAVPVVGAPAEVALFLVVGLVVGLGDAVVAGVAEVGVTVVAVAGTSGRRGSAHTSTSAATVHATGHVATGVTAAVTARTFAPGKMRDPNVCKTFARGHHRV